MAHHQKPQVPQPNAHYPGQSHADMQHQAHDNNNPGAAGEIAAEWKAIAAELTDISVGLNTVVNGLSAGWSGAAGTAARQALTKVGNFSDKLSETFTATGNSIQTQATAAEKVKNSFPKEVPYDPKAMIKDAAFSFNPLDKLTLPFDMMEQRDKSQAAKQEAERVMQQRDNAMMSAATQMPTFEDTPQVTQDQGTTQTSSTTSGKSTSTVNPNVPLGTPPGPGNSGTTNTSWAAPPVTPPTPLPGQGELPGQRVPDDRRPFPPGPGPFPPGGRPNPNDPRNNPRGGPNRGGPGGPGGAGAGRGGGGFGPGGAGGMRAGGFGPATPGGASGTMAAHGPEGRGGAAAGAAGRSGAAGTPMGAGGGGGAGQGGEDKEHKSTYLVPTDEYFEDDRMVAPPVIGG